MRDFKTILFEKAEGVAVITLNQPETLNAMSIQLEEELLDSILICRDDFEIRAVLVTGAGRAFSSGGDIKNMEKGVGAFEGKQWVEYANRIVEAITELPKPVIAAVNGPAVGGGMNLALVCDFVVASELALFSEVFVQVGLIPDTGGHWILPRMVGQRKALELIFTGKRIKADEALALGLVNSVVPPESLMSEAMSLAKKLANGPTRAFGLSKRILGKSFSTDLKEILDLESFGQSLAFATQDHKEGIQAFREKRLPAFKGE